MTDSVDEKIEEYYSLNPQQYGYLNSFHMENQKGPYGAMEQCLSLVMSQNTDFSGVSLYLEFFGVRNLVFTQSDCSISTISPIVIQRRSNESEFYENYQVYDPEQECLIIFECRDFIAGIG